MQVSIALGNILDLYTTLSLALSFLYISLNRLNLCINSSHTGPISEGLPFTLHLSRGSSALGQAAFRLRSGSARGWCSGPGWPAGSRPLALQPRRGIAVLCGLRWGTGGRPASWPHGAAVLRGEMRGGSVGCWTPAGTGCWTEGAAGGWSWSWSRGLALSAPAWSVLGSHMDPSW